MTDRRPKVRLGWSPKLADPFAVLGAVGFLAQIVDHLVSGAASDRDLVGGCIVLMLGPAVQRLPEILGRRRDDGPPPSEKGKAE